MISGGLWPTYVVKRVVDKVSYLGCQLPDHGCVIYDSSVAVRPFDFYPRDVLLARVLAMALCLSVCHKYVT